MNLLWTQDLLPLWFGGLVENPAKRSRTVRSRQWNCLASFTSCRPPVLLKCVDLSFIWFVTHEDYPFGHFGDSVGLCGLPIDLQFRSTRITGMEAYSGRNRPCRRQRPMFGRNPTLGDIPRTPDVAAVRSRGTSQPRWHGNMHRKWFPPRQ